MSCYYCNRWKYCNLIRDNASITLSLKAAEIKLLSKIIKSGDGGGTKDSLPIFPGVHNFPI
jgi:hypothetical protein